MLLSSDCSLLVDNLADHLCGAVEVLIVVDVQILFFARNHALGDVGIGALEAQHGRLGERVLLVSLDDACGEVVATEDSAEDVDEDGLNFGVVVQKFESLGELFTLSAATNIEEVGGLTTVRLNDVHGGHGESGAIDEATDVAANMNIVQIEVFGVPLPRVVLGLVLLVGEVLLAEDRVRVDGHFAVSGEHFAFLSQHEWVDLNHVGVLLHEAVVDFGENILNLVGLVFDAKVRGNLPECSGVGAVNGRNRELENSLRSLRSDILDRHATIWGVDESGGTGRAVKRDGQIHLLSDVDLPDEVNRVDRETICAALVRHECLAK